MKRENFQFDAETMVVKIGSKTIQEGGQTFMDDIARQTAEVAKKGNIVIVSSGARALGEEKMKRTQAIKGFIGTLWDKISREGNYADNTDEIRQLTASIGQTELTKRWDKAFDRYGIAISQMLYLDDQLHGSESRNTKLVLERTFGNGVAIVNANDAISSAKKRKWAIHADNDEMALHIGNLLEADTLVFLTDKDGVLDNDGQLVEFAEGIDAVEEYLIDECEGVGGMISKVENADSFSGESLILGSQGGVTYRKENHTRALIANGRRDNVILDAAKGKYGIGTWFARRSDYEW